MIDALTYPLVLGVFQRREASVYAGRDPLTTKICRYTQAFLGISCVGANVALMTASSPLLASCVTPLTLLLQVGLFYTWQSSLNPHCDPSWARQVAWEEKRMGNLSQTAVLISSVALLFFGHTAIATATIAILAIIYLDRNRYLPEILRHTLHFRLTPVLNILGLFSSSWLLKIGSALFCIEYFLPAPNRLASALPQNSLSPEVLQKILSGERRLMMNKQHLLYSVSPPIPNTDVQQILSLWDQIDWNQHERTLGYKCQKDARFIHDRPLVSCREWAGENLRKSISSIVNRNIKVGEVRDYDRLHNYLKIITEKLLREEDVAVKTDILFRLAVEGGEYCGPGQYEAIEDIYSLCVSQNPATSLLDRIALCLQESRTLLFKNVYQQQTSRWTQRMPFLKTWLNASDLHSYNRFLALFGDGLGLQRGSVDNDETAVSSLVEKTVSQYFASLVRPTFWQHYTEKTILEAIREACKTQRLPLEEFTAGWWQKWIAEQPEAQQEALYTEFGSEFSLYGYRILREDGQPTDEALGAILYSLGIFELSQQ